MNTLPAINNRELLLRLPVESKFDSPAACAARGDREIHPFFVTGLPRSRTAWLANFLTWGNTFCYHDIFLRCQRPDEVLQLFAAAPGVAVGNSDPANLFFQDRLMQLFPSAKWVIVNRSPEDASRSARAAGMPPRTVELHVPKLAELRRKVDALLVPFEKLDQLAMAVGRYINPAFDSPAERNQMLSGFNVQIEKHLLRKAQDLPIPPVIQYAEFARGGKQTLNSK